MQVPSPGSRNRPETPFGLTLGVLSSHAEANPVISKRLRQEIVSALRTLAKATGKTLAEAPAHPQHLRAQLKDFAPAKIGISQSRWDNALSLYRKALALAGHAGEFTRERAPFLPVWADLLALIEDKSDKYRVTAVARDCSARGILPDQVDDAVLKSYWDQLEQTEISRRPQDIHRALCIAWNRTAATVPSWPQQRVAVPQYRDWYARPLEDFPQQVQAEVEAYLTYLSGADILKGCPEPLRPASLRSRRYMLRQYLTAVVGTDDPATLTSLAAAVTPAAFEKALRFFLKRHAKGSDSTKDNKRLARQVAEAIIVLARYWLKVDEAHLAQLGEFHGRLKEKHTSGMGARSRKRLEQFESPKQQRALARLPIELAKAVREECPPGTAPTYAQALRFQMAVAIELCLRLVPRVGNLANIEIGRHLTWTGLDRVMVISIPGDEVKNGVPIVRPIPDDSARLIEEYIERYRPVLLKAPSDHLFPGTKGGAKQKAHLSKQVSDCIRRETGIVMHCHLFRHFAAKTYLGSHPGAYGVVRLLNGHRSVETTAQMYCDGSEATAAFLHYDQHIAALRKPDKSDVTTDLGASNGKLKGPRNAAP